MSIINTIVNWTRGSAPELDCVLFELGNQSLASMMPASYDRVLEVALKESVLPLHIAKRIDPDQTWRDVAVQYPAVSETLHRLSARIYGYRPVLICEMGSVVQADLMVGRYRNIDWKRMFDAGLVPVVEHGDTPSVDGRVCLASCDPSSRSVRDVAESLHQIRLDIVYADRSSVQSIQKDIAQCIPSVGSIVHMDAPTLKKVVIQDDNRYVQAA